MASAARQAKVYHSNKEGIFLWALSFVAAWTKESARNAN